MANTTDPIILTTGEARIILDWDDNQWYVSDIDYNIGGGDDDGDTTTGTTTASSGGVKVPDWDTSYKYVENDIVGYNGILYRSDQSQNQSNTPDDGSFWWKPIVDLTAVDAITLEGRNFDEVVRSVLGGNLITDYYKKSEVNNLILNYFNKVDAKTLFNVNDDGENETWSFKQIRADYEEKIALAESTAKQYSVDYLNDQGINGFDQSLVDTFDENIVADDVNQL